MKKILHPGDILKNKFLAKHGISQRTLSESIFVHISRITEIVRGRRGITADTDLRLSRYFGTNEGYWIDLQKKYDMAYAKNKLTKKVLRITPLSIVKG